MRLLFLTCFIISHLLLFGQQIPLQGNVVDNDTGTPLIGVTVTIKGENHGTNTDVDGNFQLTANIQPPFSLIISAIGYHKKEVEMVQVKNPLQIKLTPKTELMDEIVVTASRVQENILQSPVTIEKLDGKDIRETPSLNFYEGLQNLKGVEMVTSGLTFKQINTRGFNSTGNSRFLQLVDWMDNQTPGLGFAVGNLFGSSDIDVESVELIPGSASALYGPVAFNGVLMIKTKNPFDYQGVSAQVKLGVNHIGEELSRPQALYDLSVRYAEALTDKLAFKINLGYFTGEDWYATNYIDVDPGTPVGMRGNQNPSRNALNIYGDDDARSIEGVGRVSRTGYEERHLMDYDVFSLKANAAIHYKINPTLELIYQYNFNQGKAAYTGSNRFSINNFTFDQHRLELKGSKYFLRAYANIENSHDSYNAKGLGQLINKTWVQDLNGEIVHPDLADDTWYERYEVAFLGNIDNVPAGNHSAARQFADQGRYLPGSSSFEREKERLIQTQGLRGAGILSQSKFYHAEGQYDLSEEIKILDAQIGGNFRMYDMFTNGTLFDDIDNKILVKEWGAFLQLSRRLINENLRLTVSTRFDKNQNFKGRLTPRASAVYTLRKNHNFRASYQTGFRNPTPGDMYIKLNAGPITILGAAPDNVEGTGAYENSITTSSLDPFFGAFQSALAQGISFPDAVIQNKDLLVKSSVPYIKPEQIKTFEIGYKGNIQGKLALDINYYFSSYKDFLLNQVVIQPQSPVLTNEGSINPEAAFDLVNGNSHLFQLYTNAGDQVSAQGISLGVEYLLPNHFLINSNITWSEFNIKEADPNDIPAFNTPPYKVSFVFGNSKITPRLGFNVAWRWQDSFDWTSTFNQLRPGRVPAYSIIDAQISYKIPTLKSLIKLGGNNILNNQVFEAFGSPQIGAIGYVSILFDPFIN
ncbi:MAG: TonB-dependent receptor [Saprospiraceae bacterium]|nr:TonB-dependent receptor [Saprospiraceae bacterium]